LKLSEWQHFYRLLGEAALMHIFRVTSGIDSLFLGEPQVVAQVKKALHQASTMGAAGPLLTGTLTKALEVSEKVRSETEVGKVEISVPTAALDLARQIFGTLETRSVLLLGTDEMCEQSVRPMMAHGVGSVVVIDQSPARAQELAEKLGGTSASIGDRWSNLLRTDIVITATGCPHFLVTREEAERIATERNRVALVIIDIGMPRDVDPEVRKVDGIMLYDMEAMERVARQNNEGRAAAAVEADKIVAAEVKAFGSKLQAQTTVPTIVALRHRLEEICRQELESFIEERGPFTREQDQSIHAVTTQVIHKIASSLARELKEVPEKEEQERMTAAVNRLFHLASPKQALAGTRSEKEEKHERTQKTAIAI
jgi:glutamyl-tRNA reductase